MILCFLIPFLISSLYRNQLRSILEEMAIASQCTLIAYLLPSLLQPCFLTLIVLYAMADCLVLHCASIRLRPHLFVMGKNFSSFRQSIPLRPCLIFCLFAMGLFSVLPFLLFPPPLLSPYWEIGITCFCSLLSLFLPKPTESTSNLFYLYDESPDAGTF